MLKLKYNFFLIFMLSFSLIMVMNSNSLFNMWIFMELNVLIFLTFMIVNSNYVSIISMKYFLMSSLSSIMFIFFMNLDLINNNYEIYFLSFIMNLSMMVKLGVIPFHFWFIDMMMNLDWFMCFILSTVQKFIPFMILSNLYNNNLLFFMSLVGGFLGLGFCFKQVLLKKLLAYSSINHMFWMIMSLFMKLKLWVVYYLNYSMINMVLFYLFNIYKMNEIKDIYLLFLMKNLKLKYYLMIIMMSLGGLPPFYGFLLKWFMIMNLVDWFMNLMMICLILYSLIFLYFYMRILYNNMLLMSIKFKMNSFFLVQKVNLNSFNLMFMFILLSSSNLFMFFFWIFY